MNKATDPALIAAKIRNENASASLKEFKLKILEGTYVPLKDVNKKLAKDINEVKTKLLGLSNRIAPQISGQSLTTEEIKSLIDAVVYEALSELADTYQEEK